MRTLFLAVVGAVLLTTGATSSCGSEQGRASDSAPNVSPTTSPVASEAKPSPTNRKLLAPPTDEEMVRVGRLFERFARGDDQLAGPPVDTPVLLLLGGQPVKTISARDAMERSSWEGLCPHPGGYAGRTCPFSFIEPIAEAISPVTISMEPAQHPCAHPTPVTPAEVGGSRVVTLVPDPKADCTSYVGVELFVNDVGQIVAANVVWAEP